MIIPFLKGHGTRRLREEEGGGGAAAEEEEEDCGGPLIFSFPFFGVAPR